MKKCINDIVGMKKEKARLLCEKLGSPFRVMQEDGEHFIGTADFVPKRVNVSVSNGIVTSFYLG